MQNVSKEIDFKGEDLLQLVSFKVGEEEFGVDIMSVKEINRLSNITKVPNLPEYIEGIINLRGNVIPIVDLRKRLHISKIEISENTRLIVAEVKNNLIGFIVDSVREVLRISSNITEAPPDLTYNIDSNFVKGVSKLDNRLLMLMDLDLVVNDNEIELIKERIN